MADKKIILAVDDMPENLTLIHFLLKKDFDVRLARSAEQALSLLENTAVDLILLDIEMPRMSGFDFMEKFNENPEHKKIPVIFVTSHGSVDFINRAINHGGRDYIVKPIRSDILRNKINALLQDK